MPRKSKIVRSPDSEMDTATAAVRLGVIPRFVRAEITRGHLKARRLGKIWIIVEVDFQNYCQRREQSSNWRARLRRAGK